MYSIIGFIWEVGGISESFWSAWLSIYLTPRPLNLRLYLWIQHLHAHQH